MKKKNHSNNGFWVVISLFALFFLVVLFLLYFTSGMFIMMYSGRNGFELINRTIPDLLMGAGLLIGGVLLFLFFNRKPPERI